MSIRLSGNDKLTILSNLSTMLMAGIPILEAVESISQESSGNQRKILENLQSGLKEGKKISDTFAKFPETFNPVDINLIKGAEEAGNLDVSLKDITVNLRKEMEFSDKIKTAMVYPLFVLCVFSGVLFVVLTFVIPKIVVVFERLKVPLPLSTRILITVSNFITTYYWGLIIGLVIVGVLGYLFFIYKRRMIVNLLLSLPLLVSLIRLIDLTRFTRSFSLLLKSGIPINTALELSAKVVIRPEVEKAIMESHKLVMAGKQISEGFSNFHHVIPPLMVRIIEAGEKSGTLENSLAELSEHFEAKVVNSLKQITVLFEPISIVVIGILVGGMVLSVIAPIYQMIGSLRGR